MVIRYEKFYLITPMSLIIIPTVNLHNRNWITRSTCVPTCKEYSFGFDIIQCGRYYWSQGRSC